MSNRLEKLAALGCDVTGAMDRFLNDEEFYFSCYDKFMGDLGFVQLKNDLNNHDIPASFDCAHALKGVIANLGLAAMAEQAELSKKDSEKALKAFIDVVTEELKKGEKIQLVGFGTFEVTERAAREGRNPLTGEKMQIKASKAPKFKAGKALKDAVN